MFYIVNFTKCVSQHRFFKYSIRSYDKYYKQLKIHTWILPKELMFTSHYICFVVFMGGGGAKLTHFLLKHVWQTEMNPGQ